MSLILIDFVLYPRICRRCSHFQITNPLFLYNKIYFLIQYYLLDWLVMVAIFCMALFLIHS